MTKGLLGSCIHGMKFAADGRCLACEVATLTNHLGHLSEATGAMDGLISRLAFVLAQQLPASSFAVTDILEEWQQIKKDLDEEYRDGIV